MVVEADGGGVVFLHKSPFGLLGRKQSARHAMADVMEAIRQSKTALIFVNTRSQAERTFQELWRINDERLAIALDHFRDSLCGIHCLVADLELNFRAGLHERLL